MTRLLKFGMMTCTRRRREWFTARQPNRARRAGSEHFCTRRVVKPKSVEWELILVNLAKTCEAPREQLFGEISRVTAGRLRVGAQAPGLRWGCYRWRRWRARPGRSFFTQRSSHLVTSVEMGAQAEFWLVVSGAAPDIGVTLKIDL